MKLYVQLARAGDILTLLPILRLDFMESGIKSKLMVGKAYADILEGVTYVDTVIWEGEPWEIQKAVDHAKTLADEVVCTQVCGPSEQVKACAYGPAGQERAETTGFEKEMWKLARRLDRWDDNPPLVFDRRDKDREQRLLEALDVKPKDFVLVNLGGNTSPFPHKALLLRLLRNELPVTVVDLASVKAERFYDLLGLYERALLLVSSDSAPLHLARAVPGLPVVALTQDQPLMWNGSSWRPEHLAYCRYGDFPARACEIMDTILPVVMGDVDLGAKPIIVTNCYGVERHGNCPVELGSCGRRDSKAIGDQKRVPFLRDSIRMGILRATADTDTIIISRHGNYFLWMDELPEPSYAYRITHHDGLKTFSPVADAFSAPKSWWKAHLSEIPDLLFGSDYMWSDVLRGIFQNHGGKDVTGMVWRNRKVGDRDISITDNIPPRLSHNETLAQETMEKLGNPARFPKVTQQVPCELLSEDGYNPSVAEFEGSLVKVYRKHFGSVPSKIVTTDGKVLLEGPLSYEDPRLFIWRGQPWVSWVESNVHLVAGNWDKLVATVHFGRIENGKVVVEQVVIPPAPQKIEKNFVPVVSDDELFWIYQSWPKQQVLHSMGGNGYTKTECEGATWSYGEIRGGTPPIPHDGKLLRFFHSSLDNEFSLKQRRRYFVGAMLMESKPPFKPIAVSNRPVLFGSEDDDLTEDQRKAIPQYKDKVVFPGGVVKTDGGWLLAVGVNDCRSMLAKINEKNLNL